MSDWDIGSPAQSGAPRKPARPIREQTVEDAPSPAVQQPQSIAGDEGPAPGPDQSGPSAGAPAPRKRGWARLSYGWLGVAAVMLLVGLLAGFFIARSQSASDEVVLSDARLRLSELEGALKSSEDRNWAYYRANQALRDELERATSSSTGASPAATPARSGGPYGDGVYVVGEDIPVGTYDGTVTNGVGYWARLKDTDGSIGSIIDNGIPQGPFVLTIHPGDKAVELRGVTLTGR